MSVDQTWFARTTSTPRSLAALEIIYFLAIAPRRNS
jgi:hypothetical protein